MNPRLTNVALAPLVLPESVPVGEAAPDDLEPVLVEEWLPVAVLPDADDPGGATFETAETCVHFELVLLTSLSTSESMFKD